MALHELPGEDWKIYDPESDVRWLKRVDSPATGMVPSILQFSLPMAYKAQIGDSGYGRRWLEIFIAIPKRYRIRIGDVYVDPSGFAFPIGLIPGQEIIDRIADTDMAHLFSFFGPFIVEPSSQSVFEDEDRLDSEIQEQLYRICFVLKRLGDNAHGMSWLSENTGVVSGSDRDFVLSAKEIFPGSREERKYLIEKCAKVPRLSPKNSWDSLTSYHIDFLARPVTGAFVNVFRRLSIDVEDGTIEILVRTRPAGAGIVPGSLPTAVVRCEFVLCGYVDWVSMVVNRARRFLEKSFIVGSSIRFVDKKNQDDLSAEIQQIASVDPALDQPPWVVTLLVEGYDWPSAFDRAERLVRLFLLALLRAARGSVPSSGLEMVRAEAEKLLRPVRPSYDRIDLDGLENLDMIAIEQQFGFHAAPFGRRIEPYLYPVRLSVSIAPDYTVVAHAALKSVRFDRLGSNVRLLSPETMSLAFSQLQKYSPYPICNEVTVDISLPRRLGDLTLIYPAFEEMNAPERSFRFHQGRVEQADGAGPCIVSGFARDLSWALAFRRLEWGLAVLLLDLQQTIARLLSSPIVSGPDYEGYCAAWQSLKALGPASPLPIAIEEALPWTETVEKILSA